MEPPRCFVYALSLDGATFRYVGMTTSTWAVRWASHCSAARRSLLPGGKRTAVRCWIAKHGPEVVRVTILEVCVDLLDLKAAERRWVRKLRADGFALLNHTDGGEGTPGLRPTDAQRAAMAERMRGAGSPTFGRPRPPEVRERIAASLRGRPSALKGVPKTEEHKEKLRGRVISEEARRRMSESAKARGANNKGKPMSAEQKEKLSAARKGRKLSPEHRAKLSEAGRGRPKSPEHRARIAESVRRSRAGDREGH